MLRSRTIILLFLLLVAFPGVTTAAPAVLLEATPDGGIQPRVLTSEDGMVHLVYFRKRSSNPRNREGDLYYRSRMPGGSWSTPIRVSSHSFSHLDAIGRADMALDASGAVHVVWFQAQPEPQYFYTRSDPQRRQFEPARSLVQTHKEGLDAGAAIAALGQQVVLVWAAGDLLKEAERTIYAVSSADGGLSFGPETRIGDPRLGACACCSLAASLHPSRGLDVAYRSAIDGGGRHMQVRQSDGSYALVGSLRSWEIYACPVTTNALHSSPGGSWLVQENQSRIVLEFLAAPGRAAGPLMFPARGVADPLTETRQKNPALAINEKQEMLVVWGEAISFGRGGTLNLRVLDAQGEPLAIEVPGLNGATVTIPDFSFPAAAVLDDSFLVLY